MPSTLETLWRSSGSNVSSVPAPASTTSPPASIRAEPSTTISQARSRTWCSPSSSPGARRMMIARAPSTVSRASARRVPSGTSISFTFHDCTGADSRRSRILLLALLPEPRPKARNLPTRYGARDVGAQANRIRHAGPARLVSWERPCEVPRQQALSREVTRRGGYGPLACAREDEFRLPGSEPAASRSVPRGTRPPRELAERRPEGRLS